MDKEILLQRLKSKSEVILLTEEAMADPSIVDSLFQIVSTETSSVKYAGTKIIRSVSEQKPGLIYPYFDEVAKWLQHKNSFIKWDGIMTLSNLAAVDAEEKFAAIYEDYLALIREPQMITAANVIGNAWKIVLAKPELEPDITRRLLEVPQLIYLHQGEASPECHRIVCGRVLESFEQYFDVSGSQKAMLHFAETQLGSQRKAVAKRAEKFLKRHQGHL